jgi:hypothetical protein
LLPFTSVYFFETILFNGLWAFGVKKLLALRPSAKSPTPLRPLSPLVRASRSAIGPFKREIAQNVDYHNYLRISDATRLPIIQALLGILGFVEGIVDRLIAVEARAISSPPDRNHGLLRVLKA